MIISPSKSSNSKNNINTIPLSSNNKTDNDNINTSFSNSPIKLYCENISEINKQNENGWTPIYRSIIANNLEVLKELLKLGANPNLTNNIGESPVYLCVDIDNYEALNILLKNNADCNISKKNGTTPLHLAVKNKKEKFIKILLENGADPNISNKLYNQTPLHLAIINKIGEDILLCFKKNKADFFGIKDKYDKTPYDYAKEINDEKYFEIIKKIFEIKDIKLEKNINKLDNENIIKENNINENNINENNISESNKNKNERILNLNDIFNKIDIQINKNKENIINNKEDIIENIKDNLKEEKNNLNENKINDNNLTNQLNIVINNTNDNMLNNDNNIKNNLNNDNILKDDNHQIDSTKSNHSSNVPQIYQPKKLIKNNQIKSIKKIEKQDIEYNLNKKINKNSIHNDDNNDNNQNILIQEGENCSSLEEQNKNLKDSQKSKNSINININNITKEILTSKGRENEHNLGMGITLTSLDNNIKKTRTDINNITSISNENNHPKLSTLTENELMKNIIVDTSKKIRNNAYYNNLFNYNNTNEINNNISLENKSNSNSLLSPMNTLKTESEKLTLSNNINNINDENINYTNNKSKLLPFENGMPNNSDKKKETINDMNPLDLMNQVITTNPNIINETQEQLLNLNSTNKFNSTNNNNIRADSELLEYSKSYMTNQTNLNINSEENTLTIHNNNVKNSNNNSCKKNDFYKKISYHSIKSMHKNRINLNNKFNNLENEENINEDENENENSENKNQINSMKYKTIKKINYNSLSLNDNNKYNNSKDKNNSMNIINQYPLNLKTPNNNSNFNSPSQISFSNSKYNNRDSLNSKSNFNYNNYNKNTNKGHKISNSSLTITKNTSSMKKYEKKLSILSELENYNNKCNLNNLFNSKLNTIQPIKTSISNLEMITNENEQDIQFCSPQNISNALSSKLRDWLISCDLLCYYNLFIKNRIYNIEEFIDKIRQDKLSISYKDIEDLGIKKPGHIFRFLLKLKLDSGLIDPFLYNIILDKYNRSSLNDIRMTLSNNGFGCCCFRNGSCKLDQKIKNCDFGNDNCYGDGGNDIFSFLKKLELLNLKENFIHNGFDQIEFIMLQMFSEYKFTMEILNEFLHIYNDEDKKNVLKKLYGEKKNICYEYNIEYDTNEEKDILTSGLNDNNDISKSNELCMLF